MSDNYKNNAFSPKISIITITYNAKEYLENTIKSVIEQTYKNIEYIIIDGGSTDGTLDIIKRYEDKISYCISQKDDGIYDAMNKGIDIATGNWINFMNAGDSFYDTKTLESIFSKNDFIGVDVVYGNHNVVYPHKIKIVKAGDMDKIWQGSQFCHQSSFVNANVHKKYKFNTSNKIGADFELFYSLHKQNKIFKHIDIVVANYVAGGLSDVKRVDSVVGWWNVVKKNDVVNLFYIWLILKEMLKSHIKKFLGT